MEEDSLFYAESGFTDSFLQEREMRKLALARHILLGVFVLMLASALAFISEPIIGREIFDA